MINLSFECGIFPDTLKITKITPLHKKDWYIPVCLENVSTGHFADDTYLLFSSTNLKTIETVVNYELKLVTKWLNLNKLSLNAGKTELIVFHSIHKPFNSDGISIKLNCTKLKPVDHVKYLGIYIDKQLNWNKQIVQLSNKLSQVNGILSKLRHNAPVDVCLNVYYSLFYSHLIYGCNVWGLTSDENLKKIEVLQRKCLRIITFSDFQAHSNPLFIDLKILKIRDIIKLNHLNLLYNYLSMSLPTDLNTLFKLNTTIHTHDTRQTFHVPIINSSSYGNRSIKFYVPNLWNEIFSKNLTIGQGRTVTFDQIKSLQHFKKTLKKYFLFNYLSLLN